MSQDNATGGLVAEEGVLLAASETVVSAKGDVTALCHQLGSQIDELGARWSGEGGRSFARLHRAWQEKQQRIVGALDGLAESLQDTDRDNVATDQAQSEASMLLTSRLG